jgi:hypothetical protein
MKEEFVDTRRNTGGEAEKRRAWQSWTLKHLDFRLFAKAGLLGKENESWRNVAEHTLVVNAAAQWIARKLTEAGVPVREHVVDLTSMLHDVTKRIEKEAGVSQAEKPSSAIQSSFLEEAGYPADIVSYAEYAGRVPEMFIDDPAEQKTAMDNVPLELLITAYADARTRNVHLVPLEEARDLNKKKIPGDADIYDKWYRYYDLVEQKLFGLMKDTVPRDLTDEGVYELVRSSS